MGNNNRSETKNHSDEKLYTSEKSPIEELIDKRIIAHATTTPDRQHKKGKYTARERLDLLLDPGTFNELGGFIRHNNNQFGMDKIKPYGDGVITGFGRINERLIYVYAQDFTVLGGSLGEAHAKKITRLYDLALQNGAPIIALNDSGGARIQEGIKALGGYGDIFFRNVRCSGVIPQISAIMGPCAGGAVYSPALTDFVFMVEGTSFAFLTGPNVVREVLHEQVDMEDLGGASSVHANISGVAHFVEKDEEETLARIREILSYLPQNNLDDPPYIVPTDNKARISEDLNTIIPSDPKIPYDMLKIIEKIVDNSKFLEIQKDWAKNIIIGFARLNGYVIGIIANQPSILAGALDNEASIKASRFIRHCDCFNIPIITFVDVPGFLPGIEQEYGGIIRNGAKMLFAYSEAVVPKLAVITRKAYGGAYIVMSSKHLGCDLNLAWPTAEIAVMGGEGAVKILYKNQLKISDDPESLTKNLIKEYKETTNLYNAAETGYIDDIILPSETRPTLIEGLWTLLTKRDSIPKKKHGNIPL
ncbi:MAG: putative propionyl-CoA carboxylase beta chain 5 [Candidatus Heimdallarchaeota archaeon LC_3]|nr:MAG: putative propionyl-CoA carboxylase beta chain 5 [Candidatus Heimdallarchaeota archaeon LC_3]